MKRINNFHGILAVLLAFTLMFSLAACGTTKNVNDTNDINDESSYYYYDEEYDDFEDDYSDEYDGYDEYDQNEDYDDYDDDTSVELVYDEGEDEYSDYIDSDAVDYEWVEHMTTEETKDGYIIEKNHVFCNRWIDSEDTASIEKICSEIGIDHMPDINGKDIGWGIPSIGPGTEYPIHCAYIFGYLTAENKTEGWDITENNPKTVEFRVFVDHEKTEERVDWDDKFTRNGNMYIFYSNGIVEGCYRTWGSIPYFTRRSNDDKVLPDLKMISNYHKFPIAIAVYSPKSPNTPEGDKWYTGYNICVYPGEDDSNYFSFHPVDFDE